MAETEPSSDAVEIEDSPYRPMPSRSVQTKVIATVAVLVVAVAAVTAAIRGGSEGQQVSNAQLLRLIHASADSLNRAPSTAIRMTEQISADGQSRQLHMDGIASRADHETQITISGLGQNVSILTLNHVVYEEIPGLATLATNHNKPWVAIHSLKPTPQERQLRDSGPAAYLKVLANVDGRIYDDGRQTVNGVSTTKYSFRTNFLKVFGSVFSKLFPEVTDRDLSQAGLDNLPLSVWLDGQGITRKLALNFRFKSVSIVETAYFQPSNHVIHLAAPPASEVNTVHSLRQLVVILRDSIAQGAPSAL